MSASQTDARVQRRAALLFLAAGAAGLLLGLPGGPRPLADYLVPEARVVVHAHDLEALRAGTAGVLAGGGDLATSLLVGTLRGLVTGQLGFDPLAPGVFAELGLDPGRGLLAVGAAEDCGYLVAGAADPARLRARVRGLLAQQDLAPVGAPGEVERFQGSGQAAILAAEDADLLVVACADLADRLRGLLPTPGAPAAGPGALAERAQQLLTRVRALSPGDALPARDPGYRRALGALGPADLTVYGTPAAFLPGAPADAAASEPAALGLSLGDGRIDLVGRLTSPEMAGDLRALLAVPGPPADLLGWVPERASIVLRLGLVPRVAVERLEAALGALMPQSVDSVRQRVEALGLDWDQDVLDNLTGHLAYAQVPAPRGLFAFGQDRAASQHLLLAQIRDPARAGRALSTAFAALAEEVAGGGLDLPLDAAAGPLWRVEGPVVLLALDRALLAKLAPGAGPRLPAALPAALRAALQRPDVALLYVDLGGLGGDIPALGRLVATLAVDDDGLRVDASFLTRGGGAR